MHWLNGCATTFRMFRRQYKHDYPEAAAQLNYRIACLVCLERTQATPTPTFSAGIGLVILQVILNGYSSFVRSLQQSLSCKPRTVTTPAPSIVLTPNLRLSDSTTDCERPRILSMTLLTADLEDSEPDLALCRGGSRPSAAWGDVGSDAGGPFPPGGAPTMVCCNRKEKHVSGSSSPMGLYVTKLSFGGTAKFRREVKRIVIVFRGRPKDIGHGRITAKW